MKTSNINLSTVSLIKQIETLTKKNESLEVQLKKANAETKKANAETLEARKETKKAQTETKKALEKVKKTEEKIKTVQKDLKKMRRAEERRETKEFRIDLTPIPRYKFAVEIIHLCVLLYVRLGCGLRTVVKILEIFSEVLGSSLGKIPCHQNIEDWVKKLGLSVYVDDPTPEEFKKYAMIQDECIGVNREKLLLTLGVCADFLQRPLGHADAWVLDMRVAKSFTGEEVKQAADDAAAKAGAPPEYAVIDQGTNLVKGMKISEMDYYIDISHAMGTCLKKVYEKQEDFKKLYAAIGKAHLKYQLTDSAYLLPPNMRAIARFMNIRKWVKWAIAMLRCFYNLSEKEQQDYAFLWEYKPLLEELNAAIEVTEYMENLLKKEGFCYRTAALCQHRIIMSLFTTSNLRLTSLGVKLLDYVVKQREKLPNKSAVVNISSDIIESSFGIFKAKKSPNKLYGVTPLVLMMPLYPKVVNKSVTKKINFKDRLASVKNGDVKAWAKENLFENMVAKRRQILKQGA